MVTRVLLITGARSLADDPAAEAWARGLIAAALVGVDLLLVGDAPGPDAWAWEIARDTVREQRQYCTRSGHAGDVRVRFRSTVADTRRSTPRWSTWRWALPGASTHPLVRNAVMVIDVAEVSLSRHLIAGVLALLDGRKPAKPKPGEKRPTRGTEHTARLARDAGLTVDAQTWGSR